MTSETTYLTTDEDCLDCGEAATERECEDCGARAIVTDCGHYAQPRPIAADEAGKAVCEGCYESRG